MHSIQAQNLYECLTQARDAMLNMIITVGSLQILPPLEESRPKIQTKV
jgi:hypothetical protein